MIEVQTYHSNVRTCVCVYLYVLARTCIYVLRDVLEWFSLMRTPNIPTKHRIRHTPQENSLAELKIRKNLLP